MQALRTLLLILIAATFAVGGTVRALPMPAGEPPCHEAPASPETPGPAPMAINCCIGCLPTPGEATAPVEATGTATTAYVRADSAGDGLVTGPDPEPPRARA